MVEALLDAGHDVRVVDRDPAWVVEGAELIRADLGAAGVAAEAVEGMDAVCHQAARVGLGVDFADAPAYVSDNQLATARLLAALAAAGFAGRLVLASSMVVYGEGRYRCPAHGVVRAEPATGRRSGSGPIRSVLPGLRGAAVVGRGRRVGPSRSPLGVRRRRRSARNTCARPVGPGEPDRGERRGPALPQRVRAAPPFRHPVRRGGRAVVQRPAARRGAPGVRGRPARPATSCT